MKFANFNVFTCKNNFCKNFFLEVQIKIARHVRFFLRTN